MKMNLIWLELLGCSGNIISLMNVNPPDLNYVLSDMVNMMYSNSLMALEGQMAMKEFFNIVESKEDFILVVEGAVSTAQNGKFNIIGKYNNRDITGMEAIKVAAARAKYILATGTCATYGGISAAKPNVAGCVSVQDFLKKKVINIPGCPVNPDWITGTISSILELGDVEVDIEGRPAMFYKSTIHDFCPRRSFFEKKIFANHVGEEGCMFKIGCRGPITKTDCPTRKWNDYVNWPVGDNTPCIGCARKGFPDKMEPFIGG